MTDRDEAPETAHVEDEYEEMQACPLPLMEVLDVLHGDKTVMYGTLRVAAVSTRRGEITPAFHHATPAGMSVLMPNGDTETVSMPGVQSAANDEQDGRVAVRPDCPSTVLRPSLRGGACSPALRLPTRRFQILPKIRTATMTLRSTRV